MFIFLSSFGYIGSNFFCFFNDFGKLTPNKELKIFTVMGFIGAGLFSGSLFIEVQRIMLSLRLEVVE